MECYSQWTLQEFCIQKGLEGTLFTKEPVFMLPLNELRSVLEMPGYNGEFKNELLRLVGPAKQQALWYSDLHDYLVIAALDRQGMAYPDQRGTSRVKQPIPLSDLAPRTAVASSDAQARRSSDDGLCVADCEEIAYTDDYPFREGDFDDVVTLQLIREPVVTNTGYIMENSSFEKLVQSGQPCPCTRRLLAEATTVTSDDKKEYPLYNGTFRLGYQWWNILQILQRNAALREFHRLRSIRMYQEFKDLISKTLQKDLSDEEFVCVLRDVLNAHVSAASPTRKMALGSELFGRGTRVQVQQFQATETWPRDGESDFFVVLPQPDIARPYCIPVAGLENGLPFPANYYRVQRAVLRPPEKPSPCDCM